MQHCTGVLFNTAFLSKRRCGNNYFMILLGLKHVSEKTSLLITKHCTKNTVRIMKLFCWCKRGGGRTHQFLNAITITPKKFRIKKCSYRFEIVIVSGTHVIHNFQLYVTKTFKREIQ